MRETTRELPDCANGVGWSVHKINNKSTSSSKNVLMRLVFAVWACEDRPNSRGRVSWLGPARQYLEKFYYTTELTRLQNWVGLTCTCHAMHGRYSFKCSMCTLHPSQGAQKKLGRETTSALYPGELRGKSPVPPVHVHKQLCTTKEQVTHHESQQTTYSCYNMLLMLPFAWGRHQGNPCIIIYIVAIWCVGVTLCLFRCQLAEYWLRPSITPIGEGTTFLFINSVLFLASWVSWMV